MKILHIMLSCFYIDDAEYQENVLPRINVEDGHEVMIMASTEIFVQGNILGYIKPSKYTTKDGIPIIRLPYKKIINHYLSTKIRKYSSVYENISDFNPDLIFFHGAAAYEILTIVKYKKKNPNVKIYVDSHEDYNNSAKTFMSKLLHQVIYKRCLHKILPYIEKVFYITQETKDFLMHEYGLKEEILNYMPLGGIIYSQNEVDQIRQKIRLQHNISDDNLLLIHSGKLDKLKKTTELIKTFIKVNNDNLRLYIIGTLSDEICDEIQDLIKKDKRILYLGWKSSEELKEYLCAGDLYVQPGTQSATMQNAICSFCPVAVYPYKSHKFLLEDAAFYIKDQEELFSLLNSFSIDKSLILEKKDKSKKIALNLLDYKKIASLYC